MSCEYCEDGERLISAVGDYITAWAEIQDGSLCLHAVGDNSADECVDIRYCPMCGRDLRGGGE